jgi:DnaJ-domain-containing protein 1
VLPEALGPLARLEWLALGTLLGVLFTVVAAGTFLAGERLFPTATRDRSAHRSGETRRRTEIRRYLDAIDEPFTEDHAVEDHPVAFYLPDRDVAITFDPRTYYRIERSPTHAVLAEHEMPGFGLGARLPFETPDPAETVPEPTEAAFDVLGVRSSASDEEIRAAYRRKVKEAHPDHGGDSKSFRRVREAYAAAKERAD